METIGHFASNAYSWGQALVLGVWAVLSTLVAPLLSLSVTVLLPSLLALAVILAVTVAFLWWLHGKMVQLGEGPHKHAFTESRALSAAAAIGVANAAEIESALYLPAVTISHNLTAAKWSSTAVCKVYIEQASPLCQHLRCAI